MKNKFRLLNVLTKKRGARKNDVPVNWLGANFDTRIERLEDRTLFNAFTPGDLAVIVAAASASNTTASVVELGPTAANQTPTNTIPISAAGANAMEFSGSATSTMYLADSNDGSLLAFTGANSTATGNVNTLNPRAVGTLNAAGTFNIATTYTGTSGQQTRGATSIDDSNWYIGDQGGFYSNGTSTPSPAGNWRSVRSFGGTVYAFTASASTPTVDTISAATGGTATPLPGLPNGTSNAQDFYLVSSGSNGSTYDELYVLSASSATVGTIAKYSLVSGSWVAAATTYTTTFGGFGLAAASNGSGGTSLYVTTGTGATTANKVIELTDTNGWNSDLSITTANNVTLYTAAAGTIIKGVAFAPVAPSDQAPTNIILSASTVNENLPAGTTVGTFSTTDADSSSFTYSLVGGAGSTDNGSFTISGNTLKTAASFDFESQSSYSVRVQTDDGSGGVFSKQFTISVNNVNEAPVFNAPSYTFSVADHAPSGSSVGTPVTATDPDAGQTATLVYTLSDGTGSFVIDAGTGQISVDDNSGLDGPTSIPVTVTATDTGGLHTDQLVTINVSAPQAIAPTITSPTSASITQTTATLGGNVTSDGGATITERGVVYSLTSIDANPHIGDAGVAKITASGTTGVFTANITGLTPGAAYSFAAYATNSSGTTYTTPPSSFTAVAIMAPTVTTPTSASLTSTSATLGGNVTADGGGAVTERGIVYALTSANGNPQIGGTGVTKLSTTGTTGVFTVPVTGLTASSGYSFAAYATNSAGTTYSTVGTFSTSAAPMPVFTEGDLLVYRVGDGSAALSSAGTAVFLDEYSPAGTLVQSIPMPTVAGTGSTANPLTASGTATSEGLLSLSSNGQYLVVPGYDAAVGTTGVTSSATILREVARVDSAGTIDTTTTLGTTLSGNNVRSATSTDGTNIWVAGASGDFFTTFQSTANATALATQNSRQIEVVNGQLYVSSASGSFKGISTVGTGEPTSGTQTLAVAAADGSSGGAYGYFFATLNGGASPDTLYVADNTNGIEKYSLVGTTWTQNTGNAGTGADGYDGLTGVVNGTSVTLYATTNNGKFVQLTDTAGYNASLSTLIPTVLATAGTNEVIRGVAFAPFTSGTTDLSFSTPTITHPEGNSGATTYTFVVRRTGDTTNASSVNWAVSGTGANPADAADFVGGVLPSGTLTFTAGSAFSQPITISVNGDTTIEPDETFQVALSSPTGAALGTQSTAIGTISDDDNVANVSISADQPSQPEGNTGTTAFTFTVTRSVALTDTTTMNWTVTGSGANPANAADFGGTLPSGTVTFNPGDTTQTITVNVSGDTDVEPDEGFTVTLSNINKGVINTAAASSTISNDDTSVSIAAGQTSLAEGNSGTTPFTFTVTRTGILTGTSDVDWAVTGTGTNAADASDFAGGVLPAGTIHFAANDASETITVNVQGDSALELDEQFTVTLANPIATSLGTTTASSTILNDDFQNLQPGDIVITGFEATNPDQFSFVPLVNLTPGSTVLFADDAWDASLATPALTSNEGVLTYVVPAGGVSAGTKVVLESSGTPLVVTVESGPGSATATSNFAFNATGDNLFAYTGLSTSPNFLFAVTTTDSYLSTGITTTSTTYLPPALIIGTSAVDGLAPTGMTVANAQYTGTVTSGGKAALDAAVANKANWTTSATAITLDPTNFATDSAPTDIALTSNTIAENQPAGTTIGTFSTTDPDAGDSFTYSLVSGAGSTDNGAFTLAGGTLKAAASFDSEAQSVYSIRVETTDSGGLTFDKVFTIDVSNVNEAPHFSQASYAFAAINATAAHNGDVAGTAPATDPDAGDTLSYSIAAGNTGSAFAIDNTGKITIADVTKLTSSSFTLTVTVTDSGSLTDTANVTIPVTVANHAPTIANQTLTINSKSLTNTVVGTVVASDADAGQALTYSLAKDPTAGKVDYSGAFAIDPNTGIVTIKDATKLPKSPATSGTVQVTVTDNGSPVLSSSAIVTISLSATAGAKPIVASPIAYTIAENNKAAAVLGTIKPTLSYTGQTFVFTKGTQTDAAAFSVSSAGVVTATSVLNFEAKSSYSFTVVVADKLDSSKTTMVTINVSVTDVNELPTIAAQTMSVAENSAVGAAVGTVLASDPDAAHDATTHNGKLTYSITSGNTGNVFAINPTTGAITVAGAIDFEKLNLYKLTVTVTDDGTPALSAKNTITINVTDVNDAPTLTFKAGKTPGTFANVGQPVLDTKTIDPFASLTIDDVDGSKSKPLNPDLLTVTITLDNAAKGIFTAASLTATGFVAGPAGTYTLAGKSAADATKAITKLVFQPTQNRVAVGTAETTTFTLSVTDGHIASPIINSTTTVISTSVNDNPTITGAVKGQVLSSDKSTNTPFSGVTVHDPDVVDSIGTGQTLKTVITLDSSAKGTFTAASLAASGFVKTTTSGVDSYTFMGTATATTAAIHELAFMPTQNRVAVGSTETTTFTITVTDPITGSKPAVDKNTTVITSSTNDAPTALTFKAGGPTITLSGTTITVPSAAVIVNKVTTHVAKAATTIGKFTGVDVDPKDTFTYSFVSGSNDNAKFALSAGTLKVGTSNLAQGNYTVQLKVTDKGGLSSATLTYTIHVS